MSKPEKSKRTMHILPTNKTLNIYINSEIYPEKLCARTQKEVARMQNLKFGIKSVWKNENTRKKMTSKTNEKIFKCLYR